MSRLSPLPHSGHRNSVLRQVQIMTVLIIEFSTAFCSTLDKDGTWRIKTNEELENLIKKKKYCKIYKITKTTLGSTCN
jgi:hypothetical protein